MHLRLELTPDERQQLKDRLLESDHRSVEESLGDVWETYHAPVGRNHASYQKVTAHLQPLLKETTQRRTLQMAPWMRVASVAILLLGITGLTHYLTRQQTYNKIASNEINITTDQGQRISMTLPDGTKVSLNAESSFTYPASFGLQERNVHLSGEAYFEVTHNEKQPFVVETPQVHIKVLGTRFNVNAYPQNNYVETLLVEGKVEVYASTDHNNKLTLLPNQTGHFSTVTKRFSRHKTDKSMTLGWINGDLIFRSANLTEVFAEIEKYYGVTIHIEGKLPGDQFVGIFQRETIGDVLKNLQVHYRFTYTKTGNELTIAFKQ